MSNFSFSNNVFKKLVLQTRKSQGLFGKGLSSLTWQKTLCEKYWLLVYLPFLHRYQNLTLSLKFKTVWHWVKYVRSILCTFADGTDQGQKSTLSDWIYREYVYSVAVCKKYLTRLGELIIFEPRRENYHFSQPR